VPVKFSCHEPPDPVWASQNLSRLKEAHPGFPWHRLNRAAQKRLNLLLGFSPYATNLLICRKDLLKLFLKDPFPKPWGPITLERQFQQEGLSLKEWRSFALWLRRLKQQEILKILVRDLEGETFSRTVYAISRLADFFLQATLFWLTEHLFSSSLRENFLIIGMGKLGGRELNYSSDIDLVFFYHAAFSQKETFVTLAREILRLMDTLLEGERLFRTDLRLRPGGKEGELVYSLKAGVSYYFFQSHPFERLALVKARPVAGNLRLGKAFLKALRPAIYPRFLDYTYLEHLRDLKGRLAKEALKKGAERDLKIGPGGIREIEFFCQALQMIYGGKEPGLRTRNTLWAIQKLKRKGLLPEEEASFLKKAYIFLRSLEHRLQTVHFRQTHFLPSEKTALLRLARSVGFSGEKALENFEEELRHIRKKVNRIFEGLFQASQTPQNSAPREEILAYWERKKDAGEISETLGLPERLLEDAKNLLETKGPLAPKRRPLLKEIFTKALLKLKNLPSPEKTFARFLSFMERLGGRISFLYALKHQPEKIDALLEIFAKSSFLSHLLEVAPAAAEALFRKEGLPPLAPLLKGKDTEEALSLLRMIKNEEVFRLGYLDLKGKLPLKTLLAKLSSLADFIVEGTFRLAALQNPLPTPLIVLGLGKLGGRELGYRSDLDMIFVAENHENLVPHTKLAQKFLHFLSVPLPEGPGYEVDTRLRPEGRKGPLVVSLKGFLAYYCEEAALWEKMAILRLRPLSGDLSLGKSLIKNLHRLLASQPPGPKEAKEIWQMRLKMEKERSTKGLFNLKVGPGGLADLEFALQWLMLKNLGSLPWEGNFFSALRNLSQKNILSPSEATLLEENYLFLRRLDQLLILLLDKPGEEKEYQPEEIEICEEYLGPGILERLEKVFESNRKLLTKILEVYE